MPIVTHVHGAHTTEDSDGYPEAWYLPAARNIPAGYATGGTFYDQFKQEFEKRWGVAWQPGTAVFQYPNDQRATTLWYHDHTLGMTRLNVYAGPAGLLPAARRSGRPQGGQLPAPAPQRGDAAGITYREIPIAIQDRSFNADGSLFYPDNRAFFEGLNPPARSPSSSPTRASCDIPFIPDMVPGGQHMSDISPMWNPEFFGNTMVVNGRTWPYLQVEQRRYRLRFLNGTQARFLILKMENDMPFWQIGTEGGFLPNPVRLTELLLAPAERADVIVDFTNVPAGTQRRAPERRSGRAVRRRRGGRGLRTRRPRHDRPGDAVPRGRPPGRRHEQSPRPTLRLPELTDLAAPRQDPRPQPQRDDVDERQRRSRGGQATSSSTPTASRSARRRRCWAPTTPRPACHAPLNWMDPVSETVKRGQVEQWAFHNFTADAHPIHVHLVQFQVVSREVVDPEVSPHGDLGAGAVHAAGGLGGRLQGHRHRLPR